MPYELADYHENGFAVIPGAIDQGELAAIRDAAQRIVDGFDPSEHRSVFSTLHQDRDRDRYFFDSARAVHCFLEEDALDEAGQLTTDRELAINKIGHALHDLVPEFNHFCRLPEFAGSLRQAGFNAPQLWQTMYIFKQPHIGGEVRWHQDASYLIADDPGVIGVWVALEDSDRNNGCLWMQPGGHKSPLREIYEVDEQTPNGALRCLDTQPWPDESQAVALEVEAGSFVLFNDRMPHYSSHNHSDRSRQAFTMHFTECGTPWSSKNWLRRDGLQPFVLN